MLSGIIEISGFIGGIITVVAGIVVLIWPKIIAYIVGIYLIVIGVLAVTAALRH
jgi:uncharacterized membrane protein HdeD (DUF308 family)